MSRPWTTTARGLLAGAAGAAVVVSVATSPPVSRVFGRTLVFSAAVGNTATGAAYTRTNLVPNVLFEVVATGCSPRSSCRCSPRDCPGATTTGAAAPTRSPRRC
ncbi:MAG: hypothetical protein U0Q15_13375 [Kineosporiaceae bacterium]